MGVLHLRNTLWARPLCKAEKSDGKAPRKHKVRFLFIWNYTPSETWQNSNRFHKNIRNKFKYHAEKPVIFDYLAEVLFCVQSLTAVERMDIATCRFLPGDALTGFYCHHPDFLLGVRLCFVLRNWLGRCKTLNNMWCDTISISSAKHHLVRFTAFSPVNHADVPLCSRTLCSMTISSCSFLSPHSSGVKFNSKFFFFVTPRLLFASLVMNDKGMDHACLHVLHLDCVYFVKNSQIKPFCLFVCL